MSGRGAADDPEMASLTQTWLAVSDDPAASVSGDYWYHRERQNAAAPTSDPWFQDRLATKLAQLIGIKLF